MSFIGPRELQAALNREKELLERIDQLEKAVILLAHHMGSDHHPAVRIIMAERRVRLEETPKERQEDHGTGRF